MKFLSNRRAAIGSLVLAACLVACGGGGGADSAVAATTGSNSPALPTPMTTTTAWSPKVTDTWQWQLQGTIDTSYQVTMYDVDLFTTSQATINLLKTQGRRVVCYFSAGSYESFRPDASQFLSGDKGNSLAPPFADELWLDTRSANVRKIMKARLDLAATKGCDGVEPDNMDGYRNTPGFALGPQTQIDFNKFIAAEAQSRGLKVGLKNDVDQLVELEPFYDFAVNEQCQQYDECAGYSVFTSKGKPVFNAEYLDSYVNDSAARTRMCTASRAQKLRTLVLPILLNNTLRYSCD
jgi:hypothetical protein